MSLIFMDGFDDGLTSSKWSALNNIIIQAGGRTLNRANLRDNGDSLLRKTVNSSDEHATFIFGFAFTPFSSYSSSTVLSFLSDTNGVAHIVMGMTSNNAFTFARGGTLLATTPNNTFTPGIWSYVEIKLILHDTTGALVVKVNGETLVNLINIDTKNGGTKTVLEAVQFTASTGPVGTEYVLDDVYLCNGAGTINNDFLGDCTVETLYPNGNGNSSQLLGSDGNSTDNYLLVDEPTPSTADYVGSPTDGAKDTYTYSNLAHTVGTIQGVQIVSYAAKSDSGTRTLIHVARSGGVESTATPQFLTSSYAAIPSIIELDPNGSVDWTVTSINAAEFGVQVGAP